MANACKVPDGFGMRWCVSDDGKGTKWNNEDFGKPVPAIGVYVTISTIYFVATIGADLFRSYVRNRSWYPSRYFAINAFSITLLGITLKIPTDLTMEMPRPVDQLSKLSGSVLLCTVIAMSIPSLGTMDKSEVISNVVALTVLGVTVVVDIGIQLGTCAINKFFFEHVIVMAFLLVLLALLVSTAMTVQTIKQLLEQEFQKKSEDLRKDDEHTSCMNVDKIKEHISNYWFLAHTSNPQFVIGRMATCVASAILSVTAAGIAIRAIITLMAPDFFETPQNNYRNTIWAVLITQIVMIIIGTIGPTWRCIWWSRRGSKYVFHNGFSVEEYWVKSLKDLKVSPLRVHSKNRWRMKNARFLWRLSFTAFIKLQARVVQLSKLIRLVAIVPIGLVSKWMPKLFIWILLLALPAVAVKSSWISVTVTDTTKQYVEEYYISPYIFLGLCLGFLCTIMLLCCCCLKMIKLQRSRRYRPSEYPRPSEGNLDHPRILYVLHLEGENDFVDFIKESAEKDTEAWIKKAKNTKNAKLDELIKQYSTHINGFGGVTDFDWRLTSTRTAGESIKYCWALPVATLACVAVAVPVVDQSSLDGLLEGVIEGFKYVRQVDKNLDDRGLQNMTDAAEFVMEGLQLDKKWYDVDLIGLKVECDGERIVGKLGRVGAVYLQEFNEIMENEPADEHTNLRERLPPKVLAADCLFRICLTILSKYEQFQTNQHLFEWLRVTIADILGACLTNVPQVIHKKCSNTAIEAREESVRNAALLFGELEELLRFLYDGTKKYSQVKKYIDQWESRGSIEESQVVSIDICDD